MRRSEEERGRRKRKILIDGRREIEEGEGEKTTATRTT